MEYKIDYRIGVPKLGRKGIGTIENHSYCKAWKTALGRAKVGHCIYKRQLPTHGKPYPWVFAGMRCRNGEIKTGKGYRHVAFAAVEWDKQCPQPQTINLRTVFEQGEIRFERSGNAMRRLTYSLRFGIVEPADDHGGFGGQAHLILTDYGRWVCEQVAEHILAPELQPA